MILRKPYAFLIKHFRIIHFIVAMCTIYIMIKTWGLLDFFNGYISSGQTMSIFEDLSLTYINTLFTLAIVFVIIVASIIFYLMRHKKKPYLFYVFMLISYSLLLLLLLFTSGFLYDLQFEIPDLRFTKIIRDVLLALFAIQIPSFVILFVRAIGFDIKKFDFKKDIMDLDISDEDNAEFEFEIGLDTEDIRAKTRKRLRYLKYSYKENKFIYIGVFLILMIIVASFLVNYITSLEKIYKEREPFQTKLLEITVLDSYKTKYDYRNNLVSNSSFYIILKLRYKNNSSSDLQINTENARLSYSDFYSVAPTKLSYNKFVEFGVPYYSQTLKPGDTRDFIFVYEIPNDYYDNNFKLKYLYDITSDGNKVGYNYRTVSLKPKEYVDNYEYEVETVKNLGEELLFSDSLFGNTKIVINGISISDRFTYNITRCKNDTCNEFVNFLKPSTNSDYEMTLMLINYDISYDSLLGSGYSLNDFIARFGSIRFVINGKEYESKININDVTPYPMEDYAYLEVRAKLSQAEKIYLDFTIRDKRYTYVIKDNIKSEEETSK